LVEKAEFDERRRYPVKSTAAQFIDGLGTNSIKMPIQTAQSGPHEKAILFWDREKQYFSAPWLQNAIARRCCGDVFILSLKETV
jgi:hypothetical protein